MIKFLSTILLVLFPTLVLADAGNLSFAPPPGDYSVVFLGNMFGVVDGVLHGTGSQIMGAMFGVFNAAVLALGGIILLYTLMVGTMNTAHEGSMLGQKWSSIWIPVRATLGLALLLPKASGYCMMQIFVMWLVVQGVGAGDKVWDAALSYLNRGGVIIAAQIQPQPETMLLPNNPYSALNQGAISILAGQVCMLGLQKQLEVLRQNFLDQGADKGHCLDPDIEPLCKNPVPDFLGSVNAVVHQSNLKDNPSFKLEMPHFADTEEYKAYHFLNGICGYITWSQIEQLYTPSSGCPANTVCTPGCTEDCTGISLSASEYNTSQLSRAIAIQQMYTDLSLVAQQMVANDPQIGTQSSSDTSSPPYYDVARLQFGVPYTQQNQFCDSYGQCTGWGIDTSNTTGGVLFNGTEITGAVNNYNAVMMPVINMINQAAQGQSAVDARAFISKASSAGWLMAGAYYFDLVKLNGNAVQNSQSLDSKSGLNNSMADATTVGDPCSQLKGGTGKSYDTLCKWFGNDMDKLVAVEALIDNKDLPGGTMGAPEAYSANRVPTQVKQASTAYGFLNNSLMISTAEQPGLNQLQFFKHMSFTVDTTKIRLSPQKFNCGGVTIIAFKFCLGWMMGNLFYNLIFLNVYNILLTVFQTIIQQTVMSFVMLPLMAMSTIFQTGVQILNAPGVNPIVALAQMGVRYINYSGDLWISLLMISITIIIVPWFGIFTFALIMMAMPLVLAWLGIMVSIGFTTAYYVPLLPYMMFTFGVIAWLIAVIESMVAAPIVALGVTHPEGHEAFGKGEHAIMILLNVFLRPSMMIIGYIAAISLSYVGIWILNAGFDHAVSFFQGGSESTQGGKAVTAGGLLHGVTSSGSAKQFGHNVAGGAKSAVGGMGFDESSYYGTKEQGSGSGAVKYQAWAGIYAFFFSILSYTTIYLIIVQQSFTLISVLPDKIVRWIGGQQESLGAESSKWGEELKSAGKEAGKASDDAVRGMGKQMGGKAQEGVSKGLDKAKGFIKSQGGGGGEAEAGAGGAIEK